MFTLAQLQTLKAAIAAETDAGFVANRTAGNTGLMAEFYNGASTFVIWRTRVSPEEYRKSGFVWTEVDALTAGKARIVEWMTGTMSLDINPADANIRQGFADAFAANTATRANLLALSKRAATRGEKIFATGTGTTAVPGTLTWEGSMSDADIVLAIYS